MINDCHVLFVQSIGGPAAAKVIRADIYPIKIPDVIEADAQLKEFQAVFAAPPPWLAKALGKTAEERVRFMANEQMSQL
jgi:hypothetical protein